MSNALMSSGPISSGPIANASLSNAQSQNWEDIYYKTNDDLKLYARFYPASETGICGTPVACLPGLTRNARDFHTIATALSQNQDTPRPVYCLEYRGRGYSDHDKNWRNYTPGTELIDVLDFFTIHNLHHIHLLGTSRGGILTMLMAAYRPGIIKSAILNDIGPVLDKAGLLRIKGYVGRTPIPSNWEEATKIIADINAATFPDITQEQWGFIARAWYNEKDGIPLPSYDTNLTHALDDIDFTQDIPHLWAQFKALTPFATLAIRGANSDLLSPQTLSMMNEMHPNFYSHEVPGQGHAPLLLDEETINIIAAFLRSQDEAEQ